MSDNKSHTANKENVETIIVEMESPQVHNVNLDEDLTSESGMTI